MKRIIKRLYIKAITVSMMLAMAMMANAQQVRFYDGEQLSSNQITSLCQDRQGYIWIGTEYGLNKFDGVYFK